MSTADNVVGADQVLREQIDDYQERMEDTSLSYELGEEGLWKVETAWRSWGEWPDKESGRRTMGYFEGRFGDVLAYALQQDTFYEDSNLTPPPRDAGDSDAGKIARIDITTVEPAAAIDQMLEE